MQWTGPNYLITDGFTIFLQLNASGRTLDVVQDTMKPHVNKDLMTVCLDRAVSIRKLNMKMVFNIFGTWCRVMFEKLMMKSYDFFNPAKSFSHPV